jgi:oligopeptide transport system substrate-binding protein
MVRRFLALAGVIAVVTMSCAAGYADAETVLRRGNGTEPETLDPAKSESLENSNIQFDLFEGLVTLDARDNVRPGAAQSWTTSSGRTATR